VPPPTEPDREEERGERGGRAPMLRPQLPLEFILGSYTRKNEVRQSSVGESF